MKTVMENKNEIKKYKWIINLQMISLWGLGHSFFVGKCTKMKCGVRSGEMLFNEAGMVR